jgi:large conductance mechanosensitive channel
MKINGTSREILYTNGFKQRYARKKRLSKDKDDRMLEELKRIRELLEPKAAPPPPKGLWKEFLDFLSQYKVMGLAVAFIIGVYLGNLVKAAVQDLILPVIGLAVPGLANLSGIIYYVSKQEFQVGDFLVALVTFIIVAFVIFLIVKITKRWGVK